MTVARGKVVGSVRPSNKGARPAQGWSDVIVAGHMFDWMVIFYLCMCTLFNIVKVYWVAIFFLI